MPTSIRSLAIGILAGVALTLVALQIWGAQLQRERASVSQATVLTPLGTPAPQPYFASPLAAPWLPQISADADATAAQSENSAWYLHSLDGSAKKLSDFRGRVVFLNFWSTSCGPCLAEMPSIESLAATLDPRKFAFLAVTTDDAPTVRSFPLTHNLKIPIYLSTEKPPAQLFTFGIPTTYILDRNGAALARFESAANWDSPSVKNYLRSLSN